MALFPLEFGNQRPTRIQMNVNLTINEQKTEWEKNLQKVIKAFLNFLPSPNFNL